MKKLFLTLVLFAAVLAGSAQTSLNTQQFNTKVPALDKSPLDMSYFPADYPMLKTQNKATQAPVARVIYSRPQRDNRVVFGELVEYGKIWRLGANEATEIEFFKDVYISGKKLAKGRYTLYAIPTPEKWTLIFNKDTDTWGAFVYDEKKDVLRADVSVQTLPVAVEPFSISFVKAEKGAGLVISWEKATVNLPIEIR
ncbi:MAG TPA: DUF2911 domain-containing protein [Flavisolibacter sp.]|nr:DUF2911 domain-containing protein [Flavisolibacter sp.]